MPKNIRQLLAEIEKLTEEKKDLQRQLREARQSIDAINQGNIDALVVADKKDIKIYTEETADKIYRILIENIHEGVVTLSESETILYCNSNFANLVNQPLQKVIGSKFSDYIDDISRARFGSIFNQNRGGYSQIEASITGNGGKATPALMSMSTLSWDDKSVLSIVITDLTIQNKNREELTQRTRQLEQINTELETANKDLVTFTYVSSHDLQEPLRKIRNFVSILLENEGEKLPGEKRNYLQRTYETAIGMQTLIADLLKYSGAKSYDRVLIKTDLAVIVDEVKKDLEETITEKSATIEATHLCVADIIPFQFRQLMHNLIGNSLKFSKAGIATRIEIKASIIKGNELNNGNLLPRTDYCHIIYTDNGIGFDPQYNNRVFEVFQRLNSKEEYLGTGMGLAICKRIVDNHNGIITASGEMNKGARFDIYIPVVSQSVK